MNLYKERNMTINLNYLFEIFYKNKIIYLILKNGTTRTIRYSSFPELHQAYERMVAQWEKGAILTQKEKDKLKKGTVV